MRRDHELIREIMLRVEAHPHGFAHQVDLNIDGHTEEEVGYHCHLLIEQGLARGPNLTHQGSPSPQAVITKLTPDGHTFAENARNPIVWGKAQAIAEKAGGVSFATFVQVLTTTAIAHAKALITGDLS